MLFDSLTQSSQDQDSGTRSTRTGMTLTGGALNLDMFKNMDFDETDDITDGLGEDSQGFDSSDTFKGREMKKP